MSVTALCDRCVDLTHPRRDCPECAAETLEAQAQLDAATTNPERN